MTTHAFRHRTIKRLLPLVLLLIAWEILGQANSDFSFRYSRPSNIVATFKAQLTNPRIIEEYNIYKSFCLTFIETLTGFLIGCALGSIFGLLLWFSTETAQITKPYLVVLGSIPIFALAPVLILWFGTGFIAKVVMAVFSTFLVSTTQAYEGAQSVDDDYLNFFQVIGASRLQILKKLIIPTSLIWVFSSYKLNIGFAIIGAFIGEWISSEYGIGHIILRAGGMYDVSLIFVGLICLMIMSLLINGVVLFLEKKVIKWKVETI